MILERFIPRPVFAADGDPPGGEPSGGEPPAPTMPEGLDVKYWDQQSGQVNFPDLIGEMTDLRQFKAQADERASQIPETYEFALPQEVEVPEGLEIKYEADNPTLQEAQAVAKEIGLTQDQFGRILALDAKLKIAEHLAAGEAYDEEMKTLGENGPERIKAAESFLKANLAEDEFEALRPVISSAKALEAVEKLIKKTQTQVPNPPPTNGGEPPPPTRPADVLYGNQRAN